MTQYGMLIDIEKCNGCYNCFLACRDEYAGNDQPPYSVAQPNAGQYWMNVVEKERGSCPKVKVDYIPLPCLHCRAATCITASPEGAVYRRPDGIVLIDPKKAKGAREIVSTCPHRVIYWNAEKVIPQKCTFCAHLLDQGWKEPRCVAVCPTGALTFGDLDDPKGKLSELIRASQAEALHPEYGLDPNVMYVGLPKRFIAGEVSLADREDECAEGVTVELQIDGKQKTATTDNYGDFEFNGLASNRQCILRVKHSGYVARELNVSTKTDLNVGEIVLVPARR